MGFFDIFRISSIKQENDNLKSQITELQKKIDSLGVTEYYQTKEKIDKMNIDLEQRQEESNKNISENNELIAKLREEISILTEQESKLSKQVKTHTRKIDRSKELYNSMVYSIDHFLVSDVEYRNCKLPEKDYSDIELISPSVMLKLHCMDVKDLKKAYRENQKQIERLLEQYSSRYTTKANKSIYNLMVIALQAELQNILYNLNFV